MSKRVLVIAYHFPPIQGSSGVHRTLAFAKFLKEFGWDVTVLTVPAHAFAEHRVENLAMIPAHVEVVRAAALDTARHLNLAGWYPRFLALPDRWRTWIPGAVRAGLRIIRDRRPAAIFSTFPIASAHAIALRLRAAAGLPWVADFRDPMAQDGYPSDPAVWRSYADIEQKVFATADRITVTTHGTAEYYTQRYPLGAATKIRVIENGFDPDALARGGPNTDAVAADKPLLLLHSGVIYPVDRDPTAFLQALRRLRDENQIAPHTLRVRFRASGHEERYQQLIRQMGVADLVELAPPVPYDDALREMLSADALLLFQAKTCNRQIPAKVYEYLYAARPILGVTDPDGDTGRLLARLKVPGLARLEDAEAIYSMLRDAIRQIREQRYAIPAQAEVDKLSRRARTEELAQILNEVA